MQFRLIPALLVFLGSYFPLAVILALQDIRAKDWQSGICRSLFQCSFPSLNHPYLSLFGLLLTLVCLLLTIRILGSLRYKYPVSVEASRPIPNELISYSFPYIVSFIGVDYGSAGKVAGLAVFLFWLFLITYKAGQIIMNPVLLVLGWNLYEADVSINGHKRSIRLLSKKEPTPGIYLCQSVQGSYITMGSKQE
jgi:hypothetical protein